MSNVITREYLVDRYVHISNQWMIDLHARPDMMPTDTDTVETFERRIKTAVRKEEDRQIREGIAETMRGHYRSYDMACG